MSDLWRSGVRISYRVRGSAPDTVVFLHGLAGHAGEWERTVAALGPGFTTIVIDQRGHGASTRLPADTSRAAFVEDVAAIIDEVAGSRSVTVVGQSMGAHTAMLTASWYPDLVGRLVMVEGDVGGGGISAARELRQALGTWPERFASYEQARDFFGGDNARGHVWAQGCEQRSDGWWPRFDRHVMRAAMDPIFAAEWWDSWRSLRVPTLLVLAQHSSIDAHRIDRMCQLRPSTGRVTIANACHDVHLDQPDAWIATLRLFLTTGTAL